MNRIEFLHKKLEMYNTLLHNCVRPDRVEMVIDAYSVEILGCIKCSIPFLQNKNVLDKKNVARRLGMESPATKGINPLESTSSTPSSCNLHRWVVKD